MLILFLVFVVQFSVSCACLAISKEQQVIIVCIKSLTWWYWFPHSSSKLVSNKRFVLPQNLLLEIGWNKSESMQKDLEISLDCCDFLQVNYSEPCDAVRTIILLLYPRFMKCLLISRSSWTWCEKNSMILERPFRLPEQNSLWICSFK